MNEWEIKMPRIKWKMHERCSKHRCAAACVCSHQNQFQCVCVCVCFERKIKIEEKLGSAHKTDFLSLSWRRTLFARAGCLFSQQKYFSAVSNRLFCMRVYISEWYGVVRVCECGVFTITTYYNDCVCACSEMFRNLQFTRSTNSIEFYVSHQPVIMIICTKNTVSHVHKGHSENSSLHFIVRLFLSRLLSHALALSLFSICIHFLLKFLLTNSLGFTLECQAYKQYLCIN